MISGSGTQLPKRDGKESTMLILLVDDHPLLRFAVRQVIEHHYPSAIVREASNADDAMRIVSAQAVELVILDIELPGASGLTMLKQIKQARPKIRCVVLTVHQDPQYLRLALQHGASGYLTKEAAPEELSEAIRTVYSGGQHVSESLSGPIDARGRPLPALLPDLNLSSRELEVLALLAKGRTVSQVATRLKLSVKTVSTYRSRLLQKLHLETTADLIRYAVRSQLVK
jgi:two-component system, NarL family, invasion response regulator UvrY